MSKNLEDVVVNNARVDANLSILPTDNPSVHLPEDLTDEMEKFYSDWSGEVYAINLARLACSCLDYIHKRSMFSRTDPRRVCKHLRQKLFQNNVFEMQDDLSKSIIESGWVAAELYTFHAGGYFHKSISFS